MSDEERAEVRAEEVPAEPVRLPLSLTLRFDDERDRAFVIQSIRASRGFAGRVEIEG